MSKHEKSVAGKCHLDKYCWRHSSGPPLRSDLSVAAHAWMVIEDYRPGTGHVEDIYASVLIPI